MAVIREKCWQSVEPGWGARRSIRWYLSPRGKVEASGNAAAEDQVERAHGKERDVIATTGEPNQLEAERITLP